MTAPACPDCARLREEVERLRKGYLPLLRAEVKGEEELCAALYKAATNRGEPPGQAYRWHERRRDDLKAELKRVEGS